MDGPAGLSNKYAYIDLLAGGVEGTTSGDVEGLTEMLTSTIPQVEKLEAEYQGVCAYEADQMAMVPVLDTLHGDASRKVQEFLLPSLEELLATTTACDTVALAQRMRPYEDQLALITEGQNLLTFVRIPAARLRRLETARDLRRVEALAAALLAALSHAKTQERLENAGVFAAEGRVAIVGETSTRLRTAAQEAQREAMAAEQELRQEIERQYTTVESRMSAKHITRAEAAYTAQNLSRTITELEK